MQIGTMIVKVMSLEYFKDIAAPTITKPSMMFIHINLPIFYSTSCVSMKSKKVPMPLGKKVSANIVLTT